jgi:hypothetical protein
VEYTPVVRSLVFFEEFSMVRSIFHTVWGGLQYARMLLGSKEQVQGEHAAFPPEETTHAVLIIPGWLGPGSAGDALARRFKRKNIPACTFHIGFHTIKRYDDILMMLKRHVAQLRKACPHLTRLNLVGHSMGGQLAIDIILDGTLDGLEVQLATLGSMHRGTWSALLGCPFSHSAWTLLPIHHRFRSRHDYGRLKLVPFLSIAGTRDLIVPPRRTKHPLAVHQTVRSDHGTLLFKGKVFTLVYAFFQQEKSNKPVPLHGPELKAPP